MNLVKQGKMTIDEAVNQVKDSPSAAAVSTAAICCFSCSFPDCFHNFLCQTLLVQANRKILQDAIEREQASMTAEDGMIFFCCCPVSTSSFSSPRGHAILRFPQGFTLIMRAE